MEYVFIVYRNTQPQNESFFIGCEIVVVGPSGNQTKVIGMEIPLSFTQYTCPNIINKNNWLTDRNWNEKSHWPDTFSVQQRGADIVVTRTDLASGWDMDLRFECCANGKIYMIKKSVFVCLRYHS